MDKSEDIGSLEKVGMTAQTGQQQEMSGNTNTQQNVNTQEKYDTTTLQLQEEPDTNSDDYMPPFKLETEIGPPAVALASEQEQTISRKAMEELLPRWYRRLYVATGSPIVINMQFNKLLWWCTGRERLKVVSTLMIGSQLPPTPAALELLVTSIERSCLAHPEAKLKIGSTLKTIEFLSTDPRSENSHKQLTLNEEGVLTYRAPFVSGSSGIFHLEKLDDFMETHFRPQQLRLRSAYYDCVHETSRALSRVLGREIEVVSDLDDMLSRAPTQSERLRLLRTLVTDLGKGRRFEDAARKVDSWIEERAGYLLDAMQKTSVDQRERNAPPVKKQPWYREPTESAGVLQPIVGAFRKCCLEYHPPSRSVVGKTIKKVVVAWTEGRTLQLRPTDDGDPVQPTQFGTPVLEDGVLYYGGAFGHDSSGCWSQIELENFLNLHFRCWENGQIDNLTTVTIPQLQTLLQPITFELVSIRFQWKEIFTADLTLEERRVACEALKSKHCLFELVEALIDLSNEINGPIRINTLVITSEKSSSGFLKIDSALSTKQRSKPPLEVTEQQERGGAQQQPYPQEVDDMEPRYVLHYGPALVKGHRGCMTKTKIKRMLRLQLGLSASPEASSSKWGHVAGMVNRNATDAAKKLASSWRTWIS